MTEQTGLSYVAVPRFPTLTVATPRLQVRPAAVEDALVVQEIFADRQTRRWLPVPVEAQQVDAATWCTELAAGAAGQRPGGPLRHRPARGSARWSAACGPSAPTGSAGSPRSRTRWRRDARGFGLAAEAVDALAIALLLEHGFQRVELRVAPGNTASRRVAEKAGFTYEGLLRNAGYRRTVAGSTWRSGRWSPPTCADPPAGRPVERLIFSRAPLLGLER